MDDGDEFTPKLGKIGGRDGKKVIRYGGRILAAARLAGRKTGIATRRFDGSRIGRGASVGRLLTSRDRLSAFRARRAIVKTRLVRLGAKGLPGARAHLRYIQRDGVTREGNPGELYGPASDQADGLAFLERSAADRHQFRFIVSAEDGVEYPDLKPYIRRLMTQAEHDLGTKLDWVAVDHFNTDNPHTHIMLRGVDDRSENLIIAREYIAHGFRERAAELASLDLGPRSDREIEDRLRHDVAQERLTAIDRRLMRRMEQDRSVTAASNDPFQQSVQAGRLRKLCALGLAEDLGHGRCRLADNLEDTLRRIGERGDIIRLMQRELTARRPERRHVEQRIHDTLQEPVIGQVIRRSFSDEHRDRHYLIIDGIDGQVHYLDIGRADLTPPTPEGSIVRATRADTNVRQSDRTIDAVAKANGGIYSIERHLGFDATATQAFAEAHVRRLEALRRADAGGERLADGSWVIAANHLALSAAYEAGRARTRPIEIEILSPVGPAALTRANAATWLDHGLVERNPLAIRDAGFGREVRDAIERRRVWLREQGLTHEGGKTFRLRADALVGLKRRELAEAASTISKELGKFYRAAAPENQIEGRLTRRLDLLSGSYAIVERSKEFTLVPWRSVLDRRIGQPVSGLTRDDGVSWTFGRRLGGLSIS